MHFCEWQEIKNFFNDQRVGKIISLRDEMVKADRDILKNLSLIVFFKIDNINSFEKYKNDILIIEEDEYFFRKYVLVYDEMGENELFDQLNWNNILDELNNLLKKINLDNFRKNKYNSSLDWLIIQLFIKLPFLRISTENQKFGNLHDMIQKKLNKNKLQPLNDFILEISDLNKNVIDLEDENLDNFFNNLKKSIWK